MTEDVQPAPGQRAEPPSAVERAIQRLLAEAHLARGDELPALARRHVGAFGGTDVVFYLADLQQTVLVPFLGVQGAEAPESVQPMPIEATLAGRAFQLSKVQVRKGRSGGRTVWVPLLDGTERLGVAAVTVAAPGGEPVLDDAVIEQRLLMFAALLAQLIMSKTLYGDEIVRLRRTSSMGLAAEIQWSLLPPLTFACDQVTVAAALEPAYEVAGDTVDYAVDGHTARVAIFDGMGHGLASAQLTTMAVSSYRHARRTRQSLTDTVAHIEDTLLETFRGTSFTTAIVAELDTATGFFTWANAGHPPPLLIRHGRLVKTLHATPRPPLGIVLPRDMGDLRIPHLGVEQLESGDCVLLYTDGVTETRSPTGDFFGEARLVDLVVKNLAAGLPAPETMRRVVHSLLAHQQGRLDDDASLLLLQWPTEAASLLP